MKKRGQKEPFQELTTAGYVDTTQATPASSAQKIIWGMSLNIQEQTCRDDGRIKIRNDGGLGRITQEIKLVILIIQTHL